MANYSDYVPGSRREDVDRVALRNSSEILSFDTAKDFLRNTRVSALFPSNRVKILTVKSDTPVGDALQTLVHQKILSMPVYDSQAQTFVAFIDLLDVVFEIVETLKGNKLTDSNFSQLMKASNKLSKTSCGNVAGSSGRNPFYPIEENAPLMAAIQLMADNHVHRIPVVSNSTREDLATVITQSHVSQLILANIDKFEFKDGTVESLSIGSSKVITIDKKESTLDGFRLIHDNKVSGIAVVDSTTGTLYGNISASDIKHIGENASHISRLSESLEQYLGYVCGGNLPTPISVLTTTSFRDVLQLMVDKKVHRLYVVDGEKKPIGVISLTDILVAVVKHL